jgi:hypothetical protein
VDPVDEEESDREGAETDEEKENADLEYEYAQAS